MQLIIKINNPIMTRYIIVVVEIQEEKQGKVFQERVLWLTAGYVKAAKRGSNAKCLNIRTIHVHSYRPVIE